VLKENDKWVKQTWSERSTKNPAASTTVPQNKSRNSRQAQKAMLALNLNSLALSRGLSPARAGRRSLVGSVSTGGGALLKERLEGKGRKDEIGDNGIALPAKNPRRLKRKSLKKQKSRVNQE